MKFISFTLCIRQQFTDNVKLKCANFDSLSEQDKVIDKN